MPRDLARRFPFQTLLCVCEDVWCVQLLPFWFIDILERGHTLTHECEKVRFLSLPCLWTISFVEDFALLRNCRPSILNEGYIF